MNKSKHINRENYDGLQKHIEKIDKTSNNKMTKTDYKWLAIILAVLAVFTFINFGDTNMPSSQFVTDKANDYVVFELPEGATVGSIWTNCGVNKADNITLTLYSSMSADFNGDKTYVGDTYDENNGTYALDNGNMYRNNRLFDITGDFGKYLMIEIDKKGLVINEFFVIDRETNQPIALKVVDSSVDTASNLIDEQDSFGGGYSNKNGMYFDEVYHARTALEILNGENIYEWTHPQLGKIIIAQGIKLFGMNTFGFRITGAIFSMMTVAVAYLLGKKIFKSTVFACLSAVFLSADGLRYTLGRIATIDTYAGFFTIVAFYFMYTFYERGINPKAIIKSFLPFAIAGIFFGLAVATKWTGAYGGLGLFILFLIVALRTLDNFLDAQLRIKRNEEQSDDRLLIKKFAPSVIIAIMFGLVFFVAIPLVLYTLPFSVYPNKDGLNLFEVMIRESTNMYNYHSQLTDPHVSQSPWWSWILNGKSTYFYAGDMIKYAGMYDRIHCMTTTAIAFSGVWSLVYFTKYLYKYAKKNKSNELTADEIALFNHIKRPLSFALVGLFSTWLPWAFISRSAYMYHFYIPMMFLLILVVLYLYVKVLLERKVAYSGPVAILNGKKKDITHGAYKVIWFGSAIVGNFLLFFPVFNGLPIAYMLACIMFCWANGWWNYGLF